MRGASFPFAAAIVLALTAGEWVQVPVIKGKRQQSAVDPPKHPASSTTTPSSPTELHVAGAPGPSVDDVITIRRTVGDSFSNKESVVVASHALRDHAKDEEKEDDAEVHVEVEVDEDEANEASNPERYSSETLPFQALREAHQTLLKQSTAPVDGKLDFLRRLKNKLLRHIASLSPLTARSLAGSSGAGGEAEGRGHKGVGFPSNEGTLMSLAFLVFAVFLVKVVMQLIYAMQNSQNNNAGVRVAQMQIPDSIMPNPMGTMMNMVPAVMPPMMAAMQPAARRRRGTDVDVDEVTTRVMEAIEKVHSKLAQSGHY